MVADKASHGGQVKHTWLRSQNVRGLVKTQANDWFQHFRRKQDGAFVHATLLQETHCTPEGAADLERQYAGLWGYRAQGEPPMSYWSEGGRRAGVAILLAPEEAARWTPACRTSWTTHFMALEATIHGKRTLLCNVYAPIDAKTREGFFDELGLLDVSTYDMIIMGGDHNCTQNRLDRSTRSERHRSAAFARLLQQWQLEDTVHDDHEDRCGTCHFQQMRDQSVARGARFRTKLLR